MTRLSALLLAILATATSVLGQVGEPGGNSACAHWCADNFPSNPGYLCTSPAAHKEGPCFKCGPMKTVPSQQLCNGACTDTNTDNQNCGGCGSVCSTGYQCQGGTCKPNPPACGTHPVCDVAHICRPPASGGPMCTCFQRHGASGSACVTELTFCSGHIACASDANCPHNYVCVGTCCGNVCAVFNTCLNQGSPARMFRRGGRMGARREVEARQDQTDRTTLPNPAVPA